MLGGQSSPLISGGTLYFGSDDGHIYALDKINGTVLWKYYIGVPVKSSPVISGNALYIADYDGNLYAFVGE